MRDEKAKCPACGYEDATKKFFSQSKRVWECPSCKSRLKAKHLLLQVFFLVSVISFILIMAFFDITYWATVAVIFAYMVALLWMKKLGLMKTEFSKKTTDDT